MILDVLKIPNPLLKARAHLVEPDTPGVQGFLDSMLETMQHHPRCVGLAATQVDGDVPGRGTRWLATARQRHANEIEQQLRGLSNRPTGSLA